MPSPPSVALRVRIVRLKRLLPDFCALLPLPIIDYFLNHDFTLEALFINCGIDDVMLLIN
jgi:hypothetical protein